MSISQNKPESVVKQEHILDAAIKRFSHFGIHKTTLTEIADDLSISKPSLAYYFNDKQGLIAAVGNKILSEFLQQLESELALAENVQQGLTKLLELKRQFFRKYFLLAVQVDASDLKNAPGDFTESHEYASTQVTKIVAALMDRGIANGELKALNTMHTSRLLLDTITAFEHCSNQRKGLPDLNAFDEVYNTQLEIMDLIFNGLKK